MTARRKVVKAWGGLFLGRLQSLFINGAWVPAVFETEVIARRRYKSVSPVTIHIPARKPKPKRGRKGR